MFKTKSLSTMLILCATSGIGSMAHAQTGSISGKVWLDEPPYGQYDGEDGIPDVRLNLFDDDSPFPCSISSFDQDPFGQSRLGWMEIEKTGPQTCSFQVIAGGLEDDLQQFDWYWDYLHIEDNSTTQACANDGNDPALRKRVQAWMAVLNRDTDEVVITPVYQQEYDTGITPLTFTHGGSGSEYVTYTVDVAGPIPVKADYEVRLTVRFQQWICAWDQWYPPDDPDDFSWGTDGNMCESGGRVYRSPVCLLQTATTDANGDYAFTGLDPGDYRVAVDAWNYEPGKPTNTLFSTTGNGDPGDGDLGGVAFTLVSGTENIVEDFGFADWLSRPIPAMSGWERLVAGLLLLGAATAVVARRRAANRVRLRGPAA